jgi:hypothetical protein
MLSRQELLLIVTALVVGLSLLLTMLLIVAP